MLYNKYILLCMHFYWVKMGVYGFIWVGWQIYSGYCKKKKEGGGGYSNCMYHYQMIYNVLINMFGFYLGFSGSSRKRVVCVLVLG